MKVVALIMAISMMAISSLFVVIDKSSQASVIGYLPIYIVNTSGKPLSLYNSKNPKGSAVGLLSRGDGFRFQYSGSTGDWLYGVKGKQHILIKDKQRKKAIKVFSRFFHFELIVMIAGIASLFLFLLLIIQWLFGRPVVKNTVPQPNLKDDDVTRLLQMNQHLQSQLNIEKAARYNEVESHEKEKSRLGNEALLREQRLQQRINAQHSAHQRKAVDLEAEFKQQELALKRRFAQESEVRINVKVAQMQASLQLVQKGYLDLKKKYDQYMKDGLVLDIDFEGSEYENLLKGRKYEIYFAQKLLKNKDFTILEWASDKGFKNDIFVKSNGNPDFVIGYKGAFKFAVECKYRRGYFPDPEKRNRHLVSWAYDWQAVRYNEFKQERNIPVYVAIGLGDDPAAPKQSYMVELSQLIEKSELIAWRSENKRQRVIWKKTIGDVFLNQGTFSDDIVRLACQSEVI